MKFVGCVRQDLQLIDSGIHLVADGLQESLFCLPFIINFHLFFPHIFFFHFIAFFLSFLVHLFSLLPSSQFISFFFPSHLPFYISLKCIVPSFSVYPSCLLCCFYLLTFLFNLFSFNFLSLFVSPFNFLISLSPFTSFVYVARYYTLQLFSPFSHSFTYRLFLLLILLSSYLFSWFLF